MTQMGRFIFAAATGVWLIWACGSSSSGDNGGEMPTAGEGGERAGRGGESNGPTLASGGSNVGAGAEGTQAGSSTGPGVGGAEGTICAGVGATCVQSPECCSGICDPKTDQCASVVGACSEAGASCVAAIDCCTFQCAADGKCAAEACTSDDEACSDGSECCSGSCLEGSCGALNPSCKTAGNTCEADQDCCSSDCGDNGTCTLGGSYCVQPGDVCARDGDCCTGDCSIPDGASLGLCAEQPAGPAFCTGVDGVLCSDCGDCCSRLCAPFGPTGAKICQPANGCHVTGDLCRRDEDCCGGTDDESLPGWGNVVCEIEPGKDVGLCRNPSNGDSPGGACNPQGNVCHYKNYECNISSARANCCGGLGAKGGVCQLDPLGIPRCNGLGDTCRMEGESCASTDDCCDDRPCVPDADGNLRCGVGECQRTGDTCTINADCCPGGICIRAPGSTVGSCSGGDPNPGAGGAGNGEAGAPGTGEGGAGTTTPICAEYGQLCDASGDCCNMVPCTDGLCRYPVE